MELTIYMHPDLVSAVGIWLVAMLIKSLIEYIP
jgi:hypothetical protein